MTYFYNNELYVRGITTEYKKNKDIIPKTI